MPADRPGQCGDDEIALCCGAERSIGAKPRDLEQPLDPVVHPLGGAVHLVLDLLGRERRWLYRYRGAPGEGRSARCNRSSAIKTPCSCTLAWAARRAATVMARASPRAASNGGDPLDPAAHRRASTAEAWRRSSAALAAKASRRSATRRLIVSGG